MKNARIGVAALSLLLSVAAFAQGSSKANAQGNGPPWLEGAALQWVDANQKVVGPWVALTQGALSGAWRSPFGVVWFDLEPGFPGIDCPPTRYCSGVGRMGGSAKVAYYLTPDCSGPAHTTLESQLIGAPSDLAIMGGVFPATLYRVRVDLGPVTTAVRSMKVDSDLACRPETGAGVGQIYRMEALMVVPFVPPFVLQ